MLAACRTMWQCAIAIIGMPWRLALHLLLQVASFHLAWETVFFAKTWENEAYCFWWKQKYDRHTQPGLMYIYCEFRKNGFATSSLKNMFFSILYINCIHWWLSWKLRAFCGRPQPPVLQLVLLGPGVSKHKSLWPWLNPSSKKRVADSNDISNFSQVVFWKSYFGPMHKIS